VCGSGNIPWSLVKKKILKIVIAFTCLSFVVVAHKKNHSAQKYISKYCSEPEEQLNL
jgi:hypothetical protein